MTPRLSDKRERISLQDIAMCQWLISAERNADLWTYAFDITSDSVAQSDGSQS